MQWNNFDKTLVKNVRNLYDFGQSLCIFQFCFTASLQWNKIVERTVKNVGNWYNFRHSLGIFQFDCNSLSLFCYLFVICLYYFSLSGSSDFFYAMCDKTPFEAETCDKTLVCVHKSSVVVWNCRKSEVGRRKHEKCAEIAQNWPFYPILVQFPSLFFEHFSCFRRPTSGFLQFLMSTLGLCTCMGVLSHVSAL